MVNLSFVFFALTLPIMALAQVTFEKRIEFELNNGFSDEQIQVFGRNGFIMRSTSEKATDKMFTCRYERYNTNLELRQTLDIKVPEKQLSVESYNTENHAHTLFKDKQGHFTLVSVEVTTLEETRVSGLLPKKVWVREMSVLGNYAFFHATIKKSPFLFSVNWKTGKQTLIPIQIPGLRDKDLEIKNFQTIPHANELFLYVRTLFNKEINIYIFQLNDQGEKLDVFDLSGIADKNIINISASGIGNGKYIFTGAYSGRYTNQSEGLFFCEAERSRIRFIKFYNFLDLENFLSYLPSKKQEKIEKKKEKKEEKGQVLTINYRVADHNIIREGDNYLFLGEAYYPTYRTETYTTYINGRMVTQTRTVFDGYQYTHAVLAKFNSRGDLMWDQSFEMWPAYKPFYIKRFIAIKEETENSVDMVFASRNRIVSKAVDFNGQVIHEEVSDNLEMMYAGDKSKYTNANLDYWYDRYFITYGSQKIKNTEEKEVKKKRNVYFVSKIKY